MKRLVVRLVLSVLMSVLCFSVAQAAITYPLQLSAHILPPYGCRLSDYVVQGMERLNLTVLQRDLRYSNYDFLVRMQVKQGTKIVISSTAGYTVKSGQLTRLNSANLFNGLTADITAQDKYKENGFCLNEGAYEFVFQAFDAKNTALPVSEPVYFHTYLSKALPPACVFPANGSCVDYKSAAVSFAWMEKSVSMPSNGKRYSLEVYEMPEGFDGTDRAENLAGASEPVYRKDDINGNVTVHTAPISAGMFIKGRTYVWRVRSYSADFGQADSRVSGHVENNGYSQYSAFKFGTCVDVEDVWKKKDQAAIGAVKYDSSKKPVLESVDTSGAVAVVEWLHEPEKFCGYVVEWNMADTALAPWGQKIVSEKDSFAYISGLSYGVDYIVRLRGVICDGSEEQAYSACADNVLSFRLEKREDAECGNPVPQVTSLVSLKEAMKEGDVLSANGHDVTVLTCEMNVSGSDTTFTGTGLVSYGFLKNFFNLTVKFDNVKINDRKELLQGMVYANTDLNNCLDLNLNRLANKGSAGSGPAQRQTDKFDEFSSADNIPENKAGLAGGTMYAWDADGNRVECGTLEDTSCASNNLFVDSRHGEVLFDNLEGMEWNPPFDREKRPFDRNLTFSDYYENLDGYSVPWIGVPEGGATKVKATLLQGASVNPNDVHFVLRTGSQSIRLNAKRIDGNSSVATYEVPVFADKAGDKGAYLELSAVVSTGEGACSQQLVLGVAKVYALKREHFNVRLVPCHNVSIDEDAIAKKLNEIYKPLGKTFTVTEDELFYGDSAFAFIADTFDVKNISRRSTETEDMTFLKYIYREERGFSKDSVYLFVLPKANIDGVTGFMPRGKHVGYLFCDKNEAIDSRTVAHELGHGLFTLEHAFDYITDKTVGKTDNLMDYSDGENLKVWQWTHMDNHGPVVPFFDGEEDAMSFLGHFDLSKISEPKLLIKRQNKYIPFNFSFTSEAAYFISKMSGIPQNRIESLDLRSGLSPYFDKDAEGCITYPNLSDCSENNANIGVSFGMINLVSYYTHYDYKGNKVECTNNDLMAKYIQYYDYLHIMCHEVRHTNHIKIIKHNFNKEDDHACLAYFIYFGLQYVYSKDHDNTLWEIDAEKGSKVCEKFLWEIIEKEPDIIEKNILDLISREVKTDWGKIRAKRGYVVMKLLEDRSLLDYMLEEHLSDAIKAAYSDTKDYIQKSGNVLAPSTFDVETYLDCVLKHRDETIPSDLQTVIDNYKKSSYYSDPNLQNVNKIVDYIEKCIKQSNSNYSGELEEIIKKVLPTTLDLMGKKKSIITSDDLKKALDYLKKANQESVNDIVNNIVKNIVKNNVIKLEKVVFEDILKKIKKLNYPIEFDCSPKVDSDINMPKTPDKLNTAYNF